MRADAMRTMALAPFGAGHAAPRAPHLHEAFDDLPRSPSVPPPAVLVLAAAAASLCAVAAQAQTSRLTVEADCSGVPSHAQLKAALVAARHTTNGGFNLDMWGTVVNRDGVVCAVAYTGADRGAQWPGSRVISAQKAYTANAFSLPTLALSTAQLYTAVQPGGSLFGLQHSNPVDPEPAYMSPAMNFGLPNDPMVRRRVGGVNVFGGGLALYNAARELVGAVGVSGDTSCADHAIAWRTRHTLILDHVPAGVGPGNSDQIEFSGPWGQPHCTADAVRENGVVASLPSVRR